MNPTMPDAHQDDPDDVEVDGVDVSLTPQVRIAPEGDDEQADDESHAGGVPVAR